MKIEEVEKILKDIVIEHLGTNPEDIHPYSKFTGDLQADSLDQVELIMAVEEEFNIEISDEEAEKISTFGQAVQAIHKRLLAE